MCKCVHKKSIKVNPMAKEPSRSDGVGAGERKRIKSKPKGFQFSRIENNSYTNSKKFFNLLLLIFFELYNKIILSIKKSRLVNGYKHFEN